MPLTTRLATVAALLTLGAVACTDAAPDATAPAARRPALSAVKRWQVNVTADWTERATALAARTPVNVARLYPYLALAQLRAAEDAARIRPHPPTSAAIGAASAAVLASYFPAFAGEIEAALAAQATAEPWPGAKHEDFAAGAALGRAAAARVIAYSAGDGFGSADPGLPPSAPGHWLYNGGPLARGGLGGRPFFLASASALRPPPPPAFGSPDYLAALAEVRRIADTRTAEQTAIAQYWNVNQGPTTNVAVEQLAVALLRSHRRDAVESARILFRANAAGFDAVVACFDAKYHYWMIRPQQADPGIRTVFATPPHPSYPAAHSCVSGSILGVLAAEFPDEAARIAGVERDAALSRVYAGVHYRFDVEAGLALGHAAAAAALAADLEAVAVR